MSRVEREYQPRIDAMTIAEKMQRSASMLKWAREMIAREILAENADISPERLKWEVALRQYGSEPHVRQLIEKMLERVSVEHSRNA